MDATSTVDISQHQHQRQQQSKEQQRTPSSTGNADRPHSKSSARPSVRSVPSDNARTAAPTQPSPASISPPTKDMSHAVSSSPSLPSPTPNDSRKSPSTAGRPQTLTRNPSEDSAKASSRRPGWINNLSSKFSSSSSQTLPTRSAQPSTPQQSKPQGSSSSPASQTTEEVEKVEPYMSPKSKEASGSFFSSLTRRLSSAAQVTGNQKTYPNGTVCPRRVLNVDPNRERCLVSELDSNKLRRVSFCVDVEIASGPKYKGDDDELERKQKRKDVKLKERGEGEALKNANAVSEDKPAAETRPRSTSNLSADEQQQPQDSQTQPEGMPRDSMDGESSSRKKEKKKRSEAERKERKEQRLRRAQESGQLPIEIGGDDEDESVDNANATTDTHITPGDATVAKLTPTPKPNKNNDKPTTDPARIYRRCCQLRETPILKRITEQLMSPRTSIPGEPGIVSVLDLTGSRMQLPDVVTLGDWLAIVPVKRLLLEDADLSDEGVRVVLAGLLAAKRPEPTKRKSTQPRHRDGHARRPRYQERSGVVDKVTFKNNPRITKVGWRHISLFLYMCRSIKAIDLSMNKFPESSPATPAAPSQTGADPPTEAKKDADTADTLFKCLSERLGGNRLEELNVSECSLRAGQIRKIIDGAMMCGVSRLGLASDNLNDAGLDHVMHYLKSGICHGIDLGGNNLRDKLDRIADSLVAKPGNPCWGLSLADCNLDAPSVKPLLSAITALPNFRFIDLSHNHDLCAEDGSKYNIISLLRRYLPQMKQLKRIHLNNVGMTPQQAIALAEVLSEAPRLAHVSILQNPQLTALANDTDVTSQEEACAMYASFMMSVRCSKTLICIDIDVPSPDTNEVVQALAKQVVAYSLRNMDEFAIAEATGDTNATSEGAAKELRQIPYPDVLMHLVGHVEGVAENHDNDGPAPDDDYIVGGKGVVKALQYVLGEKANDIHRTSVPGSPASAAPRDRPGSSTSVDEMGKVKPKEVSRQLLDSARKIRTRLQPAILKESKDGDEMALRRLQFLDSTLASMIARFEEEYPETRVDDKVPFQPNVFLDTGTRPDSDNTTEDEDPPELYLTADEDDDDHAIHASVPRHNSDASLVSRSMTLEEGRLHRKSQHLRQEVLKSPNKPAVDDNSKDTQAAQARLRQEKERIRELAERIESTPGEVLRPMVDKEGWTAVLKKLGANYEDLRTMQQQDPEGWEQFIDAQTKARMNVDRDRHANPNPP